VKLRLLTARVALLQHDETTYKSDLNSVKNWLSEYFDTKHPDTIEALNMLKKLSSNNISIELPQLSESFAAVNRYKLTLEEND
jgi:uroporphyrin-3 C-methyltransferase